MGSGCLGYRAAETRRPIAIPGMKRGGDSKNGDLMGLGTVEVPAFLDDDTRQGLAGTRRMA